MVVYLVDFGQTLLAPLPDWSSHADLPESEPVGASMAGKAFIDQTMVVADRDDGVRVWVPVLEGSDRTGVLVLTVRAVDDAVLRDCEELGILAGYLIAAHARCTDLYNLYRRRQSLSLAASMQWDLLPPLVSPNQTAQSGSGLVEPAYDVGGDCYDYATNGQLSRLCHLRCHGPRPEVGRRRRTHSGFVPPRSPGEPARSRRCMTRSQRRFGSNTRERPSRQERWVASTRGRDY